MELIIKKNIDLTPALEIYLQKKFASLEKFIAAFEKAGPTELVLEIQRTTNHHRKGPVYSAAAKLRLPKTIIRAEETADDIRVAIDAAKDTLREEIEKYKRRARG
jgi:ribosomal subunit interface protein